MITRRIEPLYQTTSLVFESFEFDPNPHHNLQNKNNKNVISTMAISHLKTTAEQTPESCFMLSTPQKTVLYTIRAYDIRLKFVTFM
jgi:hypothetical protein